MNRPFGFALAVLCAVGVAGCGKSKFGAGASSTPANVFRYPMLKITTLDPAVVQDGDTIDILQQIFEGLVKWGEDSRPAPNLAEKWDILDGGKTYVFHLKHGVKFSNGREMTADDFKYSIERACTPKLKSQTAATYLFAIDGVMDKLNRKADNVRGVTVVDPYTLKIQIDQPRPYFISVLTYPCAFVVCKEAAPATAQMTDISQMVGTGPFIADSFTEDQIFTMRAFKDYHDGAPKLDRIERPIVQDAQTRLNKYKNGDVDLVQLQRQDIKAMQEDPAFKAQLKFFDRPSMYYVGMNLKLYPPFANRDVRRAIAMAINKDKIVNQTMEGEVIVANSILPPSVLGYRANANSIKYDPDQAKKLLASAGYPNGQNMPPVTLYCREDQPDLKLVSEAVAADLTDNLGMKVTVQALDWTAYLAKHTARQMPFFHMRWGADYLDPQNFLSTLLASYGAENRIYYKNDEYDALCRQADVMMGPEDQRLALYAKAEDIVLQDAPFVPIYFQRDAELINPRITGLRESVFGHLPHTTTAAGK